MQDVEKAPPIHLQNLVPNLPSPQHNTVTWAVCGTLTHARGFRVQIAIFLLGSLGKRSPRLRQAMWVLEGHTARDSKRLCEYLRVIQQINGRTNHPIWILIP